MNTGSFSTDLPEVADNGLTRSWVTNSRDLPHPIVVCIPYPGREGVLVIQRHPDLYFALLLKKINVLLNFNSIGKPLQLYYRDLEVFLSNVKTIIRREVFAPSNRRRAGGRVGLHD